MTEAVGSGRFVPCARLVPIVAAIALASCKGGAPAPAPGPPMEQLTAVAANDAPLLAGIKATQGAAQIAHLGELVVLERDLPPLAWKGKMGDLTAERGGPMVQVRRTAGDTLHYGFKVDYGELVSVPSASWICERMAKNPTFVVASAMPACAGMLRRVRLPDGAVAAFIACWTGPCPVALVRGGNVALLAVDGIADARTIPAGGTFMLLATTRWVRADGAWSGGALVPITFTGPEPSRLPDIPTDEVDARDPARIVARLVQVDVTTPTGDHTVVHVTGDRRETEMPAGRVATLAHIDETRTLGP